MDTTCPICKKDKPKPKNKYCSLSCRNVYINKLKDYSKQSKKISDSLKSFTVAKSGQFKEFKVICHRCSIEIKVIEREKRFPMKNQYYCSRACANTRGPRTDDFKQKVRLKLSNKSIDKTCKQCFSSFSTPIKNMEFCGKECRLKYKRNLSFSQSSLKTMYRKVTIFKFSLNSYPNEFDFSLIDKHGWYRAKNHGNNLTGVSRDHLFSVMEGFNQMINPLILAHPANCELVQHTKNISKNNKCSLTLDQLLDKIKNWNSKYCETFSVNKVFITEEDLREIVINLKF